MINIINFFFFWELGAWVNFIYISKHSSFYTETETTTTITKKTSIKQHLDENYDTDNDNTTYQTVVNTGTKPTLCSDLGDIEVLNWG